jgi:hypothetical protein
MTWSARCVVVPQFLPVDGAKTILFCAVVNPTEFIHWPRVPLVLPEVSLLFEEGNGNAAADDRAAGRGATWNCAVGRATWMGPDRGSLAGGCLDAV